MMGEIQRWEHHAPMGVSEMAKVDSGNYVTYADHIADRAELVRLLKEARQYPRHAGCFIEKLRLNRGIDYRCDWCKQVDALEGMK
jgi:hypothetical protein